MNKTFSNQAKWIETPQKLNTDVPYIKGIPLRPIGDNKIEYEITVNNISSKVEINNQRSYLMSKGEIYDDMCNMDILNQPEVLYNLVARYRQDKIFTFIGPTLVVVNPYRVLPEYFSKETMLRIKDKILEGNSQTQKPHIYLIAGNAYTSMIDQQKKQAIVISGESGAGKTETTKYCMQLLTSLSHQQTLPIQAKILACNPILQAFGNSKTTRNDNSSRFGKYVQIFFTNDHTIIGANINSYLLEKSRVVATAEKQRNFHIFYALIASQTMKLKKPQDYKYLERSKCYEAAGVNDKQYFDEIRKSMNNIGFSQNEQNKIWQLLSSILQLGNVEFDDTTHKQNESKPCQLTTVSKKLMQSLSKLLKIKQEDLQKILLFQKKVILKQFSYSPYNKNKCIANANTLSKAIYNAIFQFILYKIEKSLKPQQQYGNINKFLSINILDIFGFENFDSNSFEQFCINFTNQKLLKLYNSYVFERQMKILREDGLDQHISSIVPPTNENIIQLMSGKVSLFSIINDNTMPLQFKDSDIIAGFQSKLKTPCLQFDKINKNKFTIVHSQCSVKYDIEGFKQKNQDKVLQQIANIVNNLFEHDSKDQAGKTLLNKFSKEIDDLIQQLTSSNVHFIRCIKPNQKKIPKSPQEKYILTQVRYLGVFETIQIRKKTYPSRWLYDEFINRFQSLFPVNKGNNKVKTQKILCQLTKNPKDYLLGNQRVYMNSEVESKLSKKLHETMKKKVQSGKKIWKAYKKYKFKSQILKNLKKIVKRIRLWRKISIKYETQIKNRNFIRIKVYVKQKIEKQKQLMAKKLQQQKLTRQKQQGKLKQQKISQRTNLPKYFQKINIKIRNIYKLFIENCQKYDGKKQSNNGVNIKNPQIKKQNNTMINIPKLQTSIQDLNQTMYVSTGSQSDNKYERNPFPMHQSVRKDYELSQSFLNDQTVIMQKDSTVVFQGTLKIPLFDPKNAPFLKKLRLMLADKFRPDLSRSQQDQLSPPSMDAKFNIQDTPSQLMKKVVQFDSKEFFKKVLRKRTNFFGMQKDQDDILVVKHKPLTKSLTRLDEQDQKDAIKVFKEILKVSQQPKLDTVFTQVERILFLCKKMSPQLANQVLLQHMKQSNNTNQLSSIRVIQALVVFLHIFEPDPDFLLASLNFIFKKLTDANFSERQNEYFRYAYRKIMRKLITRSQIGFMPVKYQIMALMCKRIISVPVHLPVGGGSHVKAQSYETLADIKVQAMQQLGIDSKRFQPQLFSFFELTNFPFGTSEQRPLNQKINVWDLVSYWQRSAQKYGEQSEPQPSFYLILKLKFAIQTHEDDIEAVQFVFGQTYYDYFMGRIKLNLKQMASLAAIIKKFQYSDEEPQQIKNVYPQYLLQTGDPKQLARQMCQSILALNTYIQQHSIKDTQIFLKFKFLKIAQQAPLSFAYSISTEQQIKLHFKHKMLYLTDDNIIVEAVPIKSIIKYADKDNQFVFSVRGDSTTKVVYTQNGSLAVKYMVTFQNLVTNKIANVKFGLNSEEVIGRKMLEGV